jgi:hypothetical protein
VKLRWLAIAATGFVAACNVDAILEEEVAPPIHLTIAVMSAQLSLAPGGTAAVDASITRLGEYNGAVSFAIENVPEGVSASVGALTTLGKVSTATITFAATSAMPAGSYVITIKGNAGSETKTLTQLTLEVAAIPAVGVFPARQSLAVIRGGISPLNVVLTRTNYTGPVTLELTGAAGISATFAAGATANTLSATISVATSAVPGSYAMRIRATGTGISAVEAPVTIIVSPDALQLIADDAATTQASIVTSSVVVNRFGVNGALSLSVTGLPAGASVTFPSTSTTSAVARFSVGAGVVPGSYSVVLRGTADGVEASTGLQLVVGPSNVGMTLVPQSVTLLQGTSAASLLTVLRTSFTGEVAVEVLSSPIGVTVSPSEPTVSGTTTTLVVQVARELAPGTYPVLVRVVPAPTTIDGPALDPVTTTLSVTVIQAPSVDANVILDWSACSPPSWVAAQSGTGPWQRLTATQGRFSFALTAVRGGFAYEDGSAGVVVRYMSSTELTSGAVNLCTPPPPATHSVSGQAQHTGPQETVTWRLGGGAGTSTTPMPLFTIDGVRDGTHDLVGWGFTQSSATTPLIQRMFIMRDVNEGTGGSVGSVALGGPLGFAPSTVPITFSGFTGERFALTLSYLTTSACTENALWESGSPSVSGNTSLSVWGVPSTFQRSTDFHLVTANAIGTGVTRTASVSYNRVTGGRVLTLPPLLTPVISTVTGSHMRLRMFISAMPPEYNGTATLRYTSGTRSATVSATAATFTGSVVVFDFPDLGSVPGFPIDAVPPTGSHGQFTTVLEGSNGASTLCVEDASRRRQVRTANY